MVNPLRDAKNIKKYLVRASCNQLQNMLLPNLLSSLPSTKNQLLAYILLSKIGVNAGTIGIILLFL